MADGSAVKMWFNYGLSDSVPAPASLPACRGAGGTSGGSRIQGHERLLGAFFSQGHADRPRGMKREHVKHVGSRKKISVS